MIAVVGPTSINRMTTVEEGSMKQVCQNKGDPAKDWETFKMGQFLNDTWVALLDPRRESLSYSVADGLGGIPQLISVVRQRRAVHRRPIRHVLAQEVFKPVASE